MPTAAGWGNIVKYRDQIELYSELLGRSTKALLQALHGLQPEQGIPTGQTGDLLVGTDNGQYQGLRMGGATNATTIPTSTIASTPAMQTHAGVRPTMPPQ